MRIGAADIISTDQTRVEEAATATAKKRRSRRRLVKTAMRLTSPLAIVLLWQFASMMELLPPRILAGPSEIISTAGRLIASGELGHGLLPLFILWFGIGEAPKIGLVAFGAVFPVYLTLHGGIRGVDTKLIEAGRTLNLGTFGIIRHIILPGALPSLLVGVRYGLSVAWLSLVVGEQINASSGIGYIITYARDFLQTDVIIVCLLVYAIMGLLTDGLVRMIEAYLLRWRPEVTA